MVFFSKLIGRALEDTQLNWLSAVLEPSLATLTLALGVSLTLALGAGVVPALGLARRSIVQLLREG
jgi:ABC-type antimicrobial peptide transport system permease subunit